MTTLATTPDPAKLIAKARELLVAGGKPVDEDVDELLEELLRLIPQALVRPA